MDLQYNKTDSVVLPITNTRISASEYNQIAGSLMHIVNTSGLTPDGGDNTQLLNAVKSFIGRTVIETYSNGTSWYRIWSDGWCEQGGRTTSTSVTFLKSFVDTNYSFSGVSINSNSGGAASTVTNLTTTGCTYYTYGNAGGMWQACGYIS